MLRKTETKAHSAIREVVALEASEVAVEGEATLEEDITEVLL
jgi:hypothetical protein